jgi:hypothetical protein
MENDAHTARFRPFAGPLRHEIEPFSGFRLVNSIQGHDSLTSIGAQAKALQLNIILIMYFISVRAKL